MYIPRQKSYINIKDLNFALREIITNDLYSENFLKNFNQKLNEYFNTEDLIIYPSLRCALFQIFKFFNFDSNSEIIFPAHTYTGLKKVIDLFNLKCRYVDLDHTFNVNINLLASSITKKTKVIIIPHHYGLICDISKLKKKISKNIIVIEDCAQSFGGKCDKKYAGFMGDIGLFSFSRGKIFDLIGGCAIKTKNTSLKNFLLTNGKKYYKSRSIFFVKLLKYYYLYFFSSTKLANFTTYPFQMFLSKISKDDITASIIIKIFSDKYLFNSNKINIFNSIQARIGMKKLNIIDSSIKNQRKNAFYFIYKFEKNKNISLPSKVKLEKNYSIFQYFPILVNNRDRVARKLINIGIDTKKDFHGFICPKKDIYKYPFANKISKNILHIPIYNGLTSVELEYISKNIISTVEKEIY
jgi:dTDP-4-amino-4,6-dideoxygalactose transaminase